MAKCIKFHTYLIEKHLINPDKAAGYLREALEEGDLDLLRAVLGDLIEAGYEKFQLNVNKLDVDGELRHALDVEMTQRVLEVKS